MKKPSRHSVFLAGAYPARFKEAAAKQKQYMERGMDRETAAEYAARDCAANSEEWDAMWDMMTIN